MTAAPFTCDFTPQGSDVGGQSLRLVVTDALGQTAEASRNVVVSRFVAKLKLSVAKKATQGRRQAHAQGHGHVPVRRRHGPGLRGQGHADDQAQRTLDPQPGGPAVEAVHLLALGHRQARASQSFSAKVTFSGNTVLNTTGTEPEVLVMSFRRIALAVAVASLAGGVAPSSRERRRRPGGLHADARLRQHDPDLGSVLRRHTPTRTPCSRSAGARPAPAAAPRSTGQRRARTRSGAT